MSKRKSPRQRPPTQSVMKEADIPRVPKKAKTLRKGTLPLSAFESHQFLRMQAEHLRIQAARQNLEAQWAALTTQHNEAVEALGETHKMEFRFTVELNKEGTALNWKEVADDQA